jgi:hypothetical protein
MKPHPFLRPEVVALSRKRYELSITSDWRYPHFMLFLQLSPSYRLARLISTGEVDPRAVALPRDFPSVEKTYRAFGDLTRTYFWRWWITTAQYQFGVSVKPEPKVLFKFDLNQQPSDTDIGRAREALNEYLFVDRPAQSNPATLIAALPIHGDRKSMVRVFNKLLGPIYGTDKLPVRVVPYSLIHNKIREPTLLKALRVVRARAAAAATGEKKKKRLFVIGNLLKVSARNATDERTSPVDAKVQRRHMEILTSRQLHNAYLLAENAARGRFPSFDPLPNDPARPKFDYAVMHREAKSRLRWMKTELEKLKALQAARSKGARQRKD